MKARLLTALLILTCGLCFAESPHIIPANGRPERAEYVSQFIKTGAIGAEIGVWSGSFSYHVLLQKNPKKLYLIDPWIYGLQKDLEPVFIPEKQQEMEQLYLETCNSFSPFSNVEILRLRAEDAVTLFEDNYFDYVYIDGEHSYDAVMRDLTNYLPKIKVGGYLIGDDYGWTGIEPAVKDFLSMHSYHCQFVGARVGQYVLQRIR